MTRNLKALGLALVAAFAMSAVVASVAQAQGTAVITTEGGNPVTITGEGAPEPNQPTLTRGTRSVTCEVATLHGDAANGDSTIDVAPEYDKCTTSLGGPATITNTGCKFRFHLTGDAKEPEDTWTATSGLHCDPGKHIVIHAYISHNQHTEKPNEPTCQYTFTDRNAAGEGTKFNQNLEHIDFTNEPASEGTPKNWVMAHATVSKVHSTLTRGSTLICGGPVTHETGELHGTYRLKGEVKNGSDPLGVTISTK